MSRWVLRPFRTERAAFGEPRGCKCENNVATAQLSCDCRHAFSMPSISSAACNRDRNAIRPGQRNWKIIRSVKPDAERSGNDIPVLFRQFDGQVPCTDDAGRKRVHHGEGDRGKTAAPKAAAIFRQTRRSSPFAPLSIAKPPIRSSLSGSAPKIDSRGCRSELGHRATVAGIAAHSIASRLHFASTPAEALVVKCKFSRSGSYHSRSASPVLLRHPLFDAS